MIFSSLCCTLDYMESEEYVWVDVTGSMRYYGTPARPEDEAETYEKVRSALLSERKDVIVTDKTRTREITVKMHVNYPNSVVVSCTPPHLDGSDCHCSLESMYSRMKRGDFEELINLSKQIYYRKHAPNSVSSDVAWSCQII